MRLVGGDFNVTRSDSERFNRLGNAGDSALFSSIISDSTFVDLPISGQQYTWCNNHSSPASAQLDRILVGENFASSFAGCVVKVGNPKLSDHAPLTLSVQGSRTNPMFRFKHFWLVLPSFADTMKDCWTSEIRGNGSEIGTWISKCRLLGSRLRIWSKDLVNANKAHIVDLESRLESRISALEGPGISNSSSPLVSSSSSTSVSISELRATLDNCYEAENTYWLQRANVRWLKEGDKNTKFSHCIASGRRRKNWISSSNENGRIIDGEKDIAATFNSFFKNSIGTARAGLLLPDWGALYDHASSPDGLSAEFFIATWSTIGGDVTRALNELMCGNGDMGRVNKSFIILIPKVNGASSISQFRPISLTTSIMKILPNILATRLKNHITTLVDDTQCAFLKGRFTVDSYMAAYKIAHLCKRRKEDAMLVKVDMEEAFDSINWDFLCSLMEARGLPHLWISWILRILKSTESAVMVNGIPGPWFRHRRGLR
ncbi:transposon protein [Canna indica]|uniref:Transposon protein n=1 Tax=Canna indica TaxID=4628 RepID=A0AAQ3KSR5_9LILI|nr:transposon protein [Canna indica]